MDFFKENTKSLKNKKFIQSLDENIAHQKCNHQQTTGNMHCSLLLKGTVAAGNRSQPSSFLRCKIQEVLRN
jgi:hypothetical protein